jgi:hypothetical protein
MTATKEQVIRFIEQRLAWAKASPESTMMFLHQAFGAVCFYIENLGEYSDEWDSLWNTYRDKFEELLKEAQR